MTRDGRVCGVRQRAGVDPLHDLVVLQVEGSAFDPLPLARRDAEAGTPVMVVSNPSGHYYAVSTGVVARRSEQMRPAGRFQSLSITADFAKGSSGAPVCDETGSVIGVVDNTQSIYYTVEQRSAAEFPDGGEELQPRGRLAPVDRPCRQPLSQGRRRTLPPAAVASRTASHRHVWMAAPAASRPATPAGRRGRTHTKDEHENKLADDGRLAGILGPGSTPGVADPGRADAAAAGGDEALFQRRFDPESNADAYHLAPGQRFTAAELEGPGESRTFGLPWRARTGAGRGRWCCAFSGTGRTCLRWRRRSATFLPPATGCGPM